MIRFFKNLGKNNVDTSDIPSPKEIEREAAAKREQKLDVLRRNYRWNIKGWLADNVGQPGKSANLSCSVIWNFGGNVEWNANHKDSGSETKQVVRELCELLRIKGFVTRENEDGTITITNPAR